MTYSKKIFIYAFLSTSLYLGIFCTPFNLHENDPALIALFNGSRHEIREILKFLRDKENLHVPTWNPNYHTVSDNIRTNNCSVGCEIGVAFATQSIHILENTNVHKLYCIDPYRHFPSSEYHDGMNIDQRYFDVLYLTVQKRLLPYQERAELIRKTSLEAASLFLDGSLDFIYLDANHSYQSVLNDLHAWFAKVKVGGFLMGDDYEHPGFPGVKKAVDQFFANKNLKVEFLKSESLPEGKWLVRK